MSEKMLIVYYSHSGNTAKLANLIQGKTNGVLCEIHPKEKYPDDYQAVVDQAKKEIADNFKPLLNKKVDNIEVYGTIFVGTPNWWYTIAPPIATFLSEYDLAGKKIIPFYTHGGGGAGSIEKDIAKLCSKSILMPGLSVYGSNYSESQIDDWLRRISL